MKKPLVPTAGEWQCRSLDNKDEGVFIPNLVRAQAAATPDGLAVVESQRALTYKELDLRTRQASRHLRGLGVGRNVVVGLCLERSIEAVVSALAILRAGAAYLPLDPSYPVSRLSFQLNDSQARVLMTNAAMAERLSAGAWDIVSVDGKEWQERCDPSDEQTDSLKGEDLAYVIYTSGSTGQPKGVEVTHRNLRNLTTWHQQVFKLSPCDRATLQASPGFDAAVWELWPYLAIGASIHVMEDKIRANATLFRDWVISNAITIAFAPTPLAEQLIQLPWPRGTSLRFLLTGGDALHRYPPPGLPFKFVNNYGPTECTVVATSAIIMEADRMGGRPSIGRPIANTQVYVLDEDLEQLPDGSPGQLYIGGAAVSRGYRNRPALTACQFVPDRFDKTGGARLYGTGDLGCYLPDGQIAFLGRLDEQIKIRGFRIEPEEIASALKRYPEIEDAIAIAREDSASNKSLVAYIVAAPDAEISDELVREFLSASLPEFMLPSAFVLVPAFPLNRSGKIDRSALPDPTEENTLGRSRYVAPRTESERRIAEILELVLQIHRVSVNDNFLTLGGNSLLGAQVVARLSDVLGVEIPLLTVFNHPTVTKLAREVERLLVAKLEQMSEGDAERLLDIHASGNWESS